jgi:long-subunit acyl-CoA synthetase (AMP-forming)
MNETCIITKNYAGNNKTGSVGKLFKGMTVRFDENGQILVKSKYPVCHNYTIAGEAEMTRTFRPDGYIATGDCGYMDEDGYLYITGRIKDMIILSNSKKVFPRSIEEKIETNSDIENCVVFGDNKPYLVAMIVPANDQIGEAQIKQVVTAFNEQAREEEKIFRYFIHKEKFSEQNNLLSNQNKIKRQKIYQQLLSSFEELYK